MDYNLKNKNKNIKSGLYTDVKSLTVIISKVYSSAQSTYNAPGATVYLLKKIINSAHCTMVAHYDGLVKWPLEVFYYCDLLR